ncbi:hypothetical protein K438DRAFT_1713561 [Mycena galopus ATCC 62051]|nr:hypothetical protein K438DRAFT_1713561 [Mycena galopus ATCC 62051]
MSVPLNVDLSTQKLTRYVVQSSDVLADLRVNVMLEGSEKVLWFKERFLEDEEIIEHLVHNETRRIQWTMHRPRNGWYIRIRSPAFPPGAFIPLIPPRPDSPHPPGALLFESRTNAPIPHTSIPPAILRSTSDVDAASPRTSTSTVHSYPPTPTASAPSLVVHPPTPASVHARLEQAQAQAQSQAQGRQQRPPAQVITPFVLAPAPEGTSAVPPAQQTFFQRAYSMLRSSTAGPSYSFTLSRVVPPASPASGSPYAVPRAEEEGVGVSPLDSTVALTGSSPPSLPPSRAAASPPASPPRTTPPITSPSPPAEPPLLTFTDSTPTYSTTVSGLLSLDELEAARLGVDAGFWVAVALTYLEFLGERESYLAALSD